MRRKLGRCRDVTGARAPALAGGAIMKALLLAVLAATLPLLPAAPAPVSARGIDPASAMAAVDAALNVGDVDAALALFADDAAVTEPSGLYPGRRPIRRYLQDLAAQHYHAEAGRYDVEGDVVTGVKLVSLDDWRRLGLAPLDVVAEAVVQDEQIRTLVIALTAEAEARLAAARAVGAREPAQVPGGAPPRATRAAGTLEDAVATQAATRAQLRVLGDAFTCVEARFVSYRRSDVRLETVEQWYVASQLWADAVLWLAASGHGSAPSAGGGPAVPRRPVPPAGWDPSEARCHLDKGFVFLDRLWDHASDGYFPNSDPAATVVDRGARYADDNALGGLALLAAAATAPDGPLRQRYLHAARREADFLAESGVWDETFGGGFWWNTDRGDGPEGKPAHTNAVAALFFARLHEATGLDAYREWALRTILWLDTVLYDPNRQLYRWSARYEDPAGRAGAVVQDRYFNYDQGVAIEAQLLAAGLDGDPSRLTRAQGVGRALHAAFRDREGGGYNLEAGVEQVYAAYAAWASLGHLALYDVDGDAAWLEMARQNAEGLAASLGEPDGGYAYRHYRCVDRLARGCESGRFPRIVDRTRDTAAQAWMQHLQTVIARRVASR
jgi:hypothetical protein